MSAGAHVTPDPKRDDAGRVRYDLMTDRACCETGYHRRKDREACACGYKPGRPHTDAQALDSAPPGACTWVDCEKSATHLHKDKHGAVWSSLCSEHDAELSAAAIASDTDVRGILRSWVKAQGGATRAARRMLR